MIYILEDDASIRKLVVYTIQSQGWRRRALSGPPSSGRRWSVGRRTGSAGHHAAGGGRAPGAQAPALPAGLHPSLPVILLTAKSTEYDKVLGLDEGGG